MSSWTRQIPRLLLAAFTLLVAVLAVTNASAQCALCKTAVQGEAARTMNIGILVLLVPPVAIFCAIFVVAYRTGKANNEKS